MVPLRLLITLGGALLQGLAAPQGSPQEAPDSVEAPTVRLGLQVVSLPFPIQLGEIPQLPYPLGVPDWSLVPDPGGGEVGAGLSLLGRVGPESIPSPQASGQQVVPSFFQSEFGEVAVRLKGRGEFGGDWTRFQPCETGLQSTCDPGLFPQLKPDIQFGVQVQGIIADRIHVDVDYDETREFAAVNNVNVYYQGLEDEIIQRVEVGDVTLTFPDSRFLTQGIPAGNFGFRALANLGPMEVQTVWAQQNGDISTREFQLTGVGGRQGFIQEDTLVVDDADYVQGQFFFLLDPRELLDYPHVDVLSLDPSRAPPSLAPGGASVQLYRFENDPVTRQQVEGYIQADAVAEKDGEEVRESGWFRFLRQGQDYILHASGLWVALRRPLRQDEMLAVTYLTATGDTIGDFNPERIHNEGGRPVLRLLKGSGPKHQPGSPTWELEMHHVYRISSSDFVEPNSVALTLSLGELSAGRSFKRRPTGEEITLLKLLGLDEEAPVDELDPAFIYRPAQDYFEDRPPVSGTFIVFPTLTPFLEPPPVPSLGLTASETKEILGADGNRVIYESVDPVERENGGLYRLTIPFRIRSEGLISTFSLGALGIRGGSERIYFGDRLLRLGQDYAIDYDIGQVTLLDPEALFGTDPQGRVRASWEQKALFQIAPTSIFGLNARHDLGGRGRLSVLGLYQQEKTIQNRPQLGMESSSILMGGVNGEVSFGAGWLDRLAERLPGAGADTAASLSMKGEMALSLPNPNTERDVYLDDFDASDFLPLSLYSYEWHLGSAPLEEDGAVGVFPAVRDASSAAEMVWQHTWILQAPGGDSLGVFEGYFPRRDIDQQINIIGAETRETGLRLDFGQGAGPGGPGGEARWRSLTTVLSNTGTDLTRSDYLEFYAAGGEGLTLVLDLGRVSEDALFVDEGGASSGTRKGTGDPWGIGILDQEADPREGEIWNDLLDERGVWAETCVGGRGRIYPLGDPRANCTRANGRNDSEDLDGDGNLASDDRVYRYLVPLDGSSPYLVRTSQETLSSFQLYRIPLRGPDAVNVGGRVTQADWRAVKHLRITVAGAESQVLSLTRLRLIGSRWVKRGQEGILSGLAGVEPGTGGRVEVGPVSALTEGSGYRSPPGVLEELDDPSQAFSGGGVEFNEKSLFLQTWDLGPGERAEVYSRFPQRPRNFLTYREARVWAVARDGDWGPDGAWLVLKVGSDSENFYLYRTTRPQPAAQGGVSPSDWLPEIVVDFQPWLSLRRQAEEEMIRNPPGPGAPPLEIWNADSTHAVFLKDRARAPNLAAVRELSLGIWNPTGAPVQGTVWVNELRLSRPIRDSGLAGHLDVDLEAPELFRTSLSYSGQGPFFRQLSGDPSYQDDVLLSVNSTVELGRVAPEAWGVSVPVTVAYSRLSQDPTFLAQSDVRVDQVQDVRRTGVSETRLEVGLRKTTPIGNRLLDPVLEGLSLRAAYSRSRASTTTLDSKGSGLDARAEYFHLVGSRDFRLIPGFAEGVVRTLLPRAWEESLLGARFRWTPERIRMGTLYTRRDRKSFRYEQILVLPEDSAVTPTRSPGKALETNAEVNFRPLESVTAELTFFSVRDLLPPEEAINDPRVHPLLEAERAGAGSLDLGWEINRALRTRVGVRPSLATWLRTDFMVATDYTTDRNAALVERTVSGPDTVLTLQRNANGIRSTRATASLEFGPLAAALFGPVEEAVGTGEEDLAEEVPERRLLARFLESLDPVYVSRQGGLSSRFFRETVSPGASYQFGFGDLEDFRFLSGDTASLLVGRTSWSGGAGIRLPLNLSVTGAYSDARTETLHIRSAMELRTRSWPDVRISLSNLTPPESARRFLESVSVSSGYRKNSRETTYGGRGLQLRRLEESQVPLELSATWAGTLTTRYQGTFSDGNGLDPTGDTETQRRSHTLLIASSLENPPFVGDRLDGPIRLSLAYQYSSEQNCRVPAGLPSCVPFVDLLNRSVNVTLDTVVLPLEIGLHVTYTNRRSFVGRRDGSTQFQMGLFGQFLFDSGTFASPSGYGAF